MINRNITAFENSSDLIQQRNSSQISTGEFIIFNYLTENNIRFEREKYFKSLFNPKTNKLLFFDFYLPDLKMAIEYDGVHHKIPINGYKALNEQIFKDQMKTNYCKKYKIHLFRIDYFNIDKILIRLQAGIASRKGLILRIKNPELYPKYIKPEKELITTEIFTEKLKEFAVKLKIDVKKINLNDFKILCLRLCKKQKWKAGDIKINPEQLIHIFKNY